MKKFPIHSTVFLLLLFVFPQINNALHYFIVEHHFHRYNTSEKEFHHTHQTHDCEQSIFKIPSIVLFDFGYSELTTTILFCKQNQFSFDSFYRKIFFENLSDRGPP